MRSFRVITPESTLVKEVRFLESDQYKDEVNYEYLQNNPGIITTRTFDGTANNLVNPVRGSVGINLLRKAPTAYGDGIGTLANRSPSPRIISNNICASTVDEPNSLGLTNMCWMWGQFLDHELDLTPTNSAETANMTTPPDDEYPNYTIPFERSKFNEGVTTPRQQINTISSFIDATNVYGFNNVRAMALRCNDTTGKLSTTTADNGELIPIYNTKGLENAAPHGSNPEDFFLCGDIRANENLHLTAMHTLFIREHNRLCDYVVQKHPIMAGEDESVYQQARRIVSGQMQQITYYEFLPALLGDYAPHCHCEYSSANNPDTATEFSTVGYRLGHSLLPGVIPVGTDSEILLRDAFFRPSWIQQNGIDTLLVGTVGSVCNEFDTNITPAVRNFLFGPPEAGMMLDLASLNIQRGRDHGIPDYNTVREAYGLPRVTAFSQISSDPVVQSKLATTYATVDDIDPWVGALAEDHLPTAAVGPLVTAILVDQFTRLKNGDRFWWENDPALSNEDKEIIKNTTLSAVIKRNIDPSLAGLIPDNVFKV